MSTPNLLGQGDTPATSLLQKVLASAVVASGEQTVYTVPTDSAVKIATAALCNISNSTDVPVSVSVVPADGTAAGGAHRVVSAFILEQGDAISQEDGLSALKGLMLGPGDFISINAGLANNVVCVLTGVVTA